MALEAAKHSEAELLAKLGSPNANEVRDALLALEKEYPTSMEARPRIIALLKDSRAEVRRKAARVLGAIGARLTREQIQGVVALLSEKDRDTVIDGLKALRGLNDSSAAPAVVALLQSSDLNIKRDACRTLAEIGDKSAIPSIEPLTKDPNEKVRKDAELAIAKLREK